MFPHRPWTARPTISVLCKTSQPGPLVAEALGRLRDVVDEIVVAADSRMEAADLGHYATVADVLLRYEYCAGERSSPEMVIVAGPTLDSGASRLGTVDLLAPFLRRDVTVLLEDALSDAGLCVGQAWERRDEIVIRGIRPTARGLLEATLHAGRADRSHDEPL